MGVCTLVCRQSFVDELFLPPVHERIKLINQSMACLLTFVSAGEPDTQGKFFGNFPYPYMNGVLHLGHAFSISKVRGVLQS